MQGFKFSEYMGVFLDEVEEQLQILDTEIIRLEEDPTNQKIIGNIFRSAHTLKGSSSAMGFQHMKELTHQLESIFDLIRQGDIVANKRVIDIIFQSIDFLKQMRERISNGHSDEIDLNDIFLKIDVVKESKSSVIKGEKKISNIENDILGKQVIELDDYQKGLLVTTLENGYSNYLVHVTLSKESVMKSVRMFLIFNNIKEVGEVIASFPSTEEIESEQFSGQASFILVSQEEEAAVKGLIDQVSEIDQVSIQPLDSTYYIVGETIGEELVTEVKQEEEEVSMVKKEDQNPVKLKINSTVRVDIDKLEHLMNLVGELVIDQTRLIDVRNRFHTKSKQYHEELEILSEVTTNFNRVIGELQEGMMKTRMLPIEQLFNRFPRLIRDTANAVNKEIDFVMEGKETELDRTLIEEIGDPLIHLLRNSIDHGIECIEERKRQGKPKKGKITIKAYHQENHIVVSISDDGQGIDPEKIKKVALSKGVVTEEEAKLMTPRDLIFLIFHSGLSTVKEVTDISGRGVGMDIVRSHIEKLNGMIDIETEVGKGTTFTIKLPLTLAIIRSLLIELGEQTFAVPLANVLEIIRLSPSEVQTIKDRQVAVVRGNVLPLVKMDEMLRIPSSKKKNKRIFVVVVGIANQRIGIIANRTLGNQEIVIKSLGQYIGNPPYIAGATIMGNGTVALILDVASVVSEQGAMITQDEVDSNEKLASEELQIVTFKLAEEEYAIDIAQVKDIISVPTITKVVTISQHVLGIINQRGKVIPVVDLRRKFLLPDVPLTKKSRIIVAKGEKFEIGYLVDEVTQVLKVKKDVIEPSVDHSPGYIDAKVIEGVCTLEERLIALINIIHLAQMENVEELVAQKDERVLIS